MSKIINWYKELQKIDANEKIIAIAVDGKKYNYLDEIKDKIDHDFSSTYGTIKGLAFTAWTNDRIYFPVAYDGLEWMSSVPRNPSDEVTNHIGSELPEWR